MAFDISACGRLINLKHIESVLNSCCNQIFRLLLKNMALCHSYFIQFEFYYYLEEQCQKPSFPGLFLLN
jgi:hypothetical protein